MKNRWYIFLINVIVTLFAYFLQTIFRMINDLPLVTHEVGIKLFTDIVDFSEGYSIFASVIGAYFAIKGIIKLFNDDEYHTTFNIKDNIICGLLLMFVGSVCFDLLSGMTIFTGASI